MSAPRKQEKTTAQAVRELAEWWRRKAAPKSEDSAPRNSENASNLEEFGVESFGDILGRHFDDIVPPKSDVSSTWTGNRGR